MTVGRGERVMDFPGRRGFWLPPLHIDGRRMPCSIIVSIPEVPRA
jgi:hypothetical protein